MSKLKTKKTVADRFKFPKGKKKKVLKRASGQDHFNSRESGKTGRNKRREILLSPSAAKTVLRLSGK